MPRVEGGRGEESKSSNTPDTRVGGFYVEFGSLLTPIWRTLAHFGLPFAHFGLPFAHFWLAFGALWLTFGALGSLLAILALDFLAFGAP